MSSELVKSLPLAEIVKEKLNSIGQPIQSSIGYKKNISLKDRFGKSTRMENFRRKL